MTLVAAALIGLAIGFLGGLMGKGGSAIATPLLHAVGVPAIVAVAAPLPATIPSTLSAAVPYARLGLVDRRVVLRSLAGGGRPPVLGATASRWIGGAAIVTATDLVVAALGIRFLLFPHVPSE